MESRAIDNTLEALEGAFNYRDWVLSRAVEHLGQRVLEIGAGTGTMTAAVADRKDVIALEIDPGRAAACRARFAANPAVQVVVGDATDPDVVARTALQAVDSAMSFNVLEHITDDLAVLRNVYAVLPPGGRFFCFVPALPVLYGALDQALGHERRYKRRELVKLARQAGFHVVDCYYFNCVGALIWFMNGHVLRSFGRLRSSAIDLYDHWIVPPSRVLERRWRPPFGQSLVLVAERTT